MDSYLPLGFLVPVNEIGPCSVLSSSREVSPHWSSQVSHLYGDYDYLGSEDSPIGYRTTPLEVATGRAFAAAAAAGLGRGHEGRVRVLGPGRGLGLITMAAPVGPVLLRSRMAAAVDN